MTTQWTPPSASVTRRNPLQWFPQGVWYFSVVAVSLGILSPIPVAHAATRLRNPLHWLAPIGYLAAVVVAVATSRPNDPSSPTGWLIISIILVSPRAPDLAAPPGLAAARRAGACPASSPHRHRSAIAAALAARQRRVKASKLIEDDPLLARELRIGRPISPRDYDDGGLVDPNSAPAPAIAALCGTGPAVAQQIIDARAGAGVPFAEVDDVFAYTDIPVGLWDRIMDRAVTL